MSNEYHQDENVLDFNYLPLHQVLLVTGGMHGGTAVSTTELLLLGASHWIKGPPQWISGPRLPIRGVNGVRATNSGGEIFLYGGNDDSEEYLQEVGHFRETPVAPNI